MCVQAKFCEHNLHLFLSILLGESTTGGALTHKNRKRKKMKMGIFVDSINKTRYLAFCILQRVVSARGNSRVNDNFKAYSIVVSMTTYATTFLPRSKRQPVDQHRYRDSNTEMGTETTFKARMNEPNKYRLLLLCIKPLIITFQ